MLRGVRTPPQSRLHPVANLENPEAIQASLMEVIDALMRNTIDVKRAELILRALHIAVKNARQVKFGLHAYEMVKQVPDYTAAAASPSSQASGADEFELPAVTAIPYKPVDSDPHFWENVAAGEKELARQAAAARAAEAQNHAATAAPGSPSGPAVSGRSSPAATTPATKTNGAGTAAPGATIATTATGATSSRANQVVARNAPQAAAAEAKLIPRKPSVGVKEVQAQKHRHRAAR